MPAVINTNVSSLNAQRNLNSSQNSLATSLQRLSSGLRINSAKDDAAGLAISSRMSSQISGLNQAARNANDGISLAQTAEGALSSVGDALQRMRELAVQSANATNSASDRASLQKEVDQLVQQINTVASQTSFNGIKLLDGTFNQQAFQVGANAGETISINSIASAKVDALGVGTTSSYKTEVSGLAVNANKIGSGGITVNGFGIGPSVADGVSYNTTTTAEGTAAIASVAANTDTSGTNELVVSGLEINGVVIDDITVVESGVVSTAVDADDAAAAIAAGINLQSDETGVVASVNSSNELVLSSSSGEDIVVGGTVTGTGLAAATTNGAGGQSSSAISKAAAFNAVSGQTGVTATVSETSVTGVAATTGAALDGTTNFIQINGVKLGAIAAGTGTGTQLALSQANNIAASVNAVSDKTGVTATFDSAGKLTLNAKDGRNINIQFGGTAATANTGLTAGTTFAKVSLSSQGSGGITLGGTDIATAGLSTGNTAATATFGAGLSTVNISTADGAQNALTTIDAALKSINESRANLGAIQNRFSNVVSNLNTTAENVTAARSRILDADFAAETANLSRAQILQQAGTAMLAQANQLPQNVLSLLR